MIEASRTISRSGLATPGGTIAGRSIRLVCVFALVGVLAAIPATASNAQDEGGGTDLAAPAFLTVVDAAGGSMNARTDRLTLRGVEPRAVWFTDRPARRTGTFAIGEMIRVFFDDQDPPNAVLEFAGAGAKRDVAVVELSSPEYDRKTKRLTFDVQVLDDPTATLDGDSALDDFVTRHDGKIPKSFGATSVFIDAAAPTGPSTTPNTSFTVRVNNQSNESWDFYMFQRAPGGDPQIVSLAWLAKYAAAQTTVTFSWQESFTLMWADTGSLVPGVVFDAGQAYPADPSADGPARPSQPGRWVGLVYDASRDDFLFVDGPPVADPGEGMLYVQSDGSVPTNIASVGVGMSGAATLATPAQTNLTVQFPTTGLRYFVAAAPSVQQGEMLENDVSQAAELTFDGTTNLTATFNADHTWTVTPS